MPTAKRAKPLLVGEQNPYGGDPYFALYPSPEGCSGHRLCCLILGMRRAAYLDSFDRKNLCDGKWDMRLARRWAQELRTWPAPIILLGSKVARAFEFVPFEPFTVQDGGKTLILPHPSGLCRMWNEPGSFARARLFVAQVVPSVSHLLGAADYVEDYS
jgi:hypothetical protein